MSSRTCHVARNAILGHQAADMPDCPLVPRGVSARVESTGSGFAIEVSSHDPAVAKEILARAQRLTGPKRVPRSERGAGARTLVRHR